jgi:hypothetical protein
MPNLNIQEVIMSPKQYEYIDGNGAVSHVA